MSTQSAEPSNKTNDKSADANNQNEGEGSYTAARRYNEGVAGTVKSGKAEALGKKAEEALDGPEGESLRRADAAGKAGQTSQKSQKSP